MGDKAISQLSKFKEEGTLIDVTDLARAYLYTALVRIVAADMFDDFVFSDRTNPAPPVGEDNMASVYDKAIEHLTQAIAIAKEAGDGELEAQALALRARAKHAKAVWGLLNPAGNTPANPFVNAGADDAREALAMVNADWKWQLEYSSSTTANNWSYQVNSRQELAILAQPNDPIDNIEDPRIAAAIAEFTDLTKGDRYSPITVVSAREMHLIIAESYLATGNTASAQSEVNLVRAYDNLTAWSDQISAKEILEWERRANLFIQGRRLADMYRFGSKSANWLPTSAALRVPGTFFPIPIQERRANPYISVSSK